MVVILLELKIQLRKRISDVFNIESSRIDRCDAIVENKEVYKLRE